MRLFWKIIGSLYIKIYQFCCLVFVKVQMPNCADIGPGLYIASGGNIIMGLNKAGKNLTVHHNVTIGMDLGRSFEPPTFGDNVCIYSNCVVTSNRIGDSVTVLENSILTKCVASNLVLGGNPARIRKDCQDNGQAAQGGHVSVDDEHVVDLFKTDLDRYLSRKSSQGKSWLSMLGKPGLQAIIVHRMGVRISQLMKRPVLAPFVIFALPLQRLLRYVCCLLYGINIHSDVKIGKGFSISHFGGILLEKCVIGDCCNIDQHVVIKCINSDSYPIIGSNVWIGSNAVIIGNVKIGSNSTISACSCVTCDVQEGALVAGNPARVVSVKYDNSNLL